MLVHEPGQERVARLGRLGLRRVERLRVERLLDGALRLAEREERRVELVGQRAERRVDAGRVAQRALGLARAGDRAPARAGARVPVRAGERVLGPRQRRGEPPRVAQAQEPRGQLLVLTRAEPRAIELLVRGAPAVLLVARALRLAHELLVRVARLEPRRVAPAHRVAQRLEPGPAVEQVPLPVGGQEARMLVLAVHLDERGRELGQRPDGDRRLVDPGAAPAFAGDLAAHHDLAVLGRDAPPLQEREGARPAPAPGRARSAPRAAPAPRPRAPRRRPRARPGAATARPGGATCPCPSRRRTR